MADRLDLIAEKRYAPRHGEYYSIRFRPTGQNAGNELCKIRLEPQAPGPDGEVIERWNVSTDDRDFSRTLLSYINAMAPYGTVAEVMEAIQLGYRDWYHNEVTLPEMA